METEQEDSNTVEEKSFFMKLLNGDFDLATMYWFFGVLGSLALTLLLNTVGQASDEVFLGLFVLASVYLVSVWIGTWRAADKFTGNEIWAVAARIMVAFSALRYLNGIFGFI